MFNQIISGKTFRKYLSTDNDPLFLFHRWQANLRILDIDEIKQYYNASRAHYSLDGQTPEEKSGVPSAEIISLNQYRWEEHCRGLFQTPIAV